MDRSGNQICVYLINLLINHLNHNLCIRWPFSYLVNSSHSICDDWINWSTSRCELLWIRVAISCWLPCRTLPGVGPSCSGCFIFYSFPTHLAWWIWGTQSKETLHVNMKQGCLHGAHWRSDVQNSGISIPASICYFLYIFLPQSFCKFNVNI